MIVSKSDAERPLSVDDLYALAARAAGDDAVYLEPSDVAPDPPPPPPAQPTAPAVDPRVVAEDTARIVADAVRQAVAGAVGAVVSGPQVSPPLRRVKKTPFRDADQRIIYVIEEELP